MPTLIVGLLVVVVSAVGFGLAMFGRRPLPQPATAGVATIAAPVTASRDSSDVGRRSPARPSTEPTDLGRLRVDVPAPVRIRSAFLLGLGVIAASAIVGILLSVAVVGFFTLIA